MDMKSIWALAWDHGDGVLRQEILATDEQMKALVEEIRQKNPELLFVSYEVSGSPMSVKEFRREFSLLFEGE